MVQCIVSGCGNRSSRKSKKQEELEKKQKISFFTFPKNEKRKKLWCKALNITEACITQSSSLCSLHFQEKDLYGPPDVLRMIRLKEDAIPFLAEPTLTWKKECSRFEIYNNSNPFEKSEVSATPVLKDIDQMETGQDIDVLQFKLLTHKKTGAENKEEENNQTEVISLNDYRINDTHVRNMEVIELVSDDDQSDGAARTSKSKACNSNCINFKCQSGVDMKPAPSFACAYYGVTGERKKRVICKECFNTALQHQQQLVRALVQNKPLLSCDFPDHTMEVEISDSDESDCEEKKETDIEEHYVPEDIFMDIKDKLDDTLMYISKKYNIKHQIEVACKDLKDKWKTINATNHNLDMEIRGVMRTMDKLRNDLYDEYKPQIKMVEEIQINDGPAAESLYPFVATKVCAQTAAADNQVEILPIERDGKQMTAPNLPPTGPLVKTAPEVDNFVFVMKSPSQAWIKGKVHYMITQNPWCARVKLLSNTVRTNKERVNMKTIYGKQIALAQICKVIIPVGTRVIAIFNDATANGFFSGIIAETPKSTNKYRYLVFFDDGYAQYITHQRIHVVWESSQHVWEDVPSDSRDFVKKYLESYPERPMVKLQSGQIVKTEWNGKWWIARVMQVDASLVQMYFDADGRTEWIYRGSARLGPLYCELMKASARQQGNKTHHVSSIAHNRLPRTAAASNKSNLPYVEYTSNVEADEEVTQNARAAKATVATNAVSAAPAPAAPTPAALQQPRAVAKKSTTKRPINMDSAAAMAVTPYNSQAEMKPSHSIVFYHTKRKYEPKKYVLHKCSLKCIKGIKVSYDDLKGLPPLAIPLLCGWHRQLCKFSKTKKVILYQAPCGIRLRNMEELHRYLRATGSTLSVDLFDFDYWVRAFADFVVEKCFINIKDLSYGVENVPIPCVNDLDHTQPDTIRYTTRREPTEGVHLNLDPAFLCSCDCEDDCQDKTKCQCWQLTIQGATLGGKVPDTAVGYVYKRLPEPVTTGIYECNSGCKCSVKTCLNRVVQHPLRLKLQVFKTGPRGWGIRCLNDIPHGAFICIYAGRLLTEQGANEGGKNYGDEYLAELDYVEVVEGIKEGYESDVLETEEPTSPADDTDKKDSVSDEEDDDNSKDNTYDSDEDFITTYLKNSSFKTSEPSSIRKRLRKRKKNGKDVRSSPEILEDSSEDGITTKSSEKSSASENRLADQDVTNVSDDDDSRNNIREPSRFEPSVEPTQIERPAFKSVRDFFGEDEAVYIMDAKTTGNIGRYLNHSCDPNIFVQNVFVDTHDVRFPWVAFFALQYIKAGQELTWNYSYDVGSIPGKVIICKCGAANCRGRLL